MLKLLFTKTPTKGPGFGQSWSHKVEPPDAAMMAEYLALSPRSQFVYEYGWKQKLNDGTSSCTTESAFIGAVDKNRDSVVNGTVRGRDIVTVVEKKTDLESMVETIAGENVDRDKKTRTKAERAALIELYIRIRRVDLTKEAETRLAANKENAEAVNPAILAELKAMGLVPADAVESPVEEKPKNKKAA